jgi:uncharacterized membrane protein YozB (DUF420 family)
MVYSSKITQQKTQSLSRAESVKKASRLLFITAICGLILYIAVRAILAAFYNEDFPESLAVKVELMPIIFPIHMVTGGLALVLLPLAYILRHNRQKHRLVGRIAAVDVIISGITAFPVAMEAPVTFWSTAGFTMQAVTWLTLLALGIWYIRQKRVEAHKACMIMMTATTFGAVFFRLYLGVWALAGNVRYFEIFYAIDAWIAWLLPLIVCAVILRRQHQTRAAYSL